MIRRLLGETEISSETIMADSIERVGFKGEYLKEKETARRVRAGEQFMPAIATRLSLRPGRLPGRTSSAWPPSVSARSSLPPTNAGRCWLPTPWPASRASSPRRRQALDGLDLLAAGERLTGCPLRTASLFGWTAGRGSREDCDTRDRLTPDDAPWPRGLRNRSPLILVAAALLTVAALAGSAVVRSQRRLHGDSRSGSYCACPTTTTSMSRT